MGDSDSRLDIIAEGSFNNNYLYVDINRNLYQLDKSKTSLPKSPIISFTKHNKESYFIPFTPAIFTPRMAKSFKGSFLDDHDNQEVVNKIETTFERVAESERKLDVIAKADSVKLPFEVTPFTSHADLYLDRDFNVFMSEQTYSSNNPSNDVTVFNNISYFREPKIITSEMYSSFVGNFLQSNSPEEAYFKELLIQMLPVSSNLKDKSIPSKMKHLLDNNKLKRHVFSGTALDVVGLEKFEGHELYLDDSYNLQLLVDDQTPYLSNSVYSTDKDILKEVSLKPNYKIALFAMTSFANEPGNVTAFRDSNRLTRPQYARIAEQKDKLKDLIVNSLDNQYEQFMF